MAKQLLLQSMTTNRLLYVAPAWVDLAVKFTCNRALMMSTQRFIALRVIRGYRTVSRATALVLSGTVLSYLVLVLEKRAIHKLRRGARDRAVCAQWLREGSLKAYQRRWKTDVSMAKWMRRIFLNISK